MAMPSTYKNQSNNQWKKLFDSLSSFQKISLVLIMVVVAAGIFMLVRWTSTPEYTVLYANLNHEEAAMVVEELNAANFDYRLSDDGTSVMVQKADLADARLALASEGMPFSAVTGFELFDQQFFGLTDFTQRVNYQRALEGELSRTITEIDEIESARVHLVLSEDQIFAEERSDSSASIVVRLKQGRSLHEGNVSAIKNLTANAVNSLRLEDISIIDAQGNLLTAGSEANQILSEQQKAVSSIERDIESKINNMLIQLVGAGNSIVKVSADLNMDKRASETETYLPGEDGQGVVLDSTQVSERYDRNISDDAAEGAAGVDANVPLVEQENEENIPVFGEDEGLGMGETSFYERSEEAVQYGISRRIDTVEFGSGEIERLNIGVFINSNISPEAVGDIQTVITAAAGINEARGDTLSIRRMDFVDMEQQVLDAEALPAAAERNWIVELLARIWPAILLVIMLFLLTLRSLGILDRKKLHNRKRNRVLVSELDNQLDQLSGSGGQKEVEGTPQKEIQNGSMGMGSNFFATRDTSLSKEEKRKRIMEIRKKVLSRMDENIYPELKEIISVESAESPQTAAKVIKNWLAEKA